MAAFATILSIATYVGLVYTIPPPQCFAKFNANNCGKSPQPVMYYWKTGSRCEVGIWRGCLPNMNMFKDEYECVSTCIFTVRGEKKDWRSIIEEDNTENMTDYEDTISQAPTTGEPGDPEGQLNTTSEGELTTTPEGELSTLTPTDSSASDPTTTEEPSTNGTKLDDPEALDPPPDAGTGVRVLT